MPHRRIRSHDNAWDRVAPLTVEPIEALWPGQQRALPSTQSTYAAYTQALEAYFRGQSQAAAVLHARLLWCRACSAMVEHRARERKPLEGLSGFLRLTKGAL